VETFLLRKSRCSGVDGLAGMSASAPLAPNGLVAPSAAAGGLRLLRPLRGARRRDLRALCVSRGVEWEEDPTNQDMRYLRNRIRRVLERSAPASRGTRQVPRKNYTLDVWEVDATGSGLKPKP